MLRTIAKPFGWLLLKLYELTGSYGLALIIFALAVRIIMLPFQIKSKLGLMRAQRLQPQLKELEKKYGANTKKYGEEMQKLYKEEGVKPSSGCFWTFLQLPIMLALYQAIRFPITVMMGVGSDLLAAGGAIYEKLVSTGYTTTISAAYEEIAQAKFISENFTSFAGLSDKLTKIDFSFIGLNLGAQPDWKIWTFVKLEHMWPAIGLFAIPFLAAFLSMMQTKAGSLTNGPTTQKSEESMNSMMATMPMITLLFCFSMPAAMGLYWAAGSLFSILQDVSMAGIYKKIYEKENAEAIEREKKRQADFEAKRAETERLREQNATVQNSNTSKKKLQMQERLEREAKQAEYEGAADGKNPGKVGDRPNARGRAYDPSRYENSDE